MSKNESLDSRLKDILQCMVCKFLPKAAVFQCTQGHLICNACFVAIQKEGPVEVQCPQCGSQLPKDRAARNVAVERVVQELPIDCRFCSQLLPRRLMDIHQRDVCLMRPTACYYRILGCAWRGPQSEVGAHEKTCPWPHKPGAELMSALYHSDQSALQVKRQSNRVFDLLSAEDIFFQDIQLRPGQECMESVRFEAFSNTWQVQAQLKDQTADPQLTYRDCYSCESSEFFAFDNTWVVRARVSRAPLNMTPDLTYQLVLKSKGELPCEVTFCMLQGPYGDYKVQPVIHKHQFKTENDVSSDVTISFTDAGCPYKAESTRFLNFRIFMFLTPKKA